jgi:hypothetical protein
MYLLNIDNPTRSCTLHEANCNFVLLRDTNRKGVEKMLSDGGWFGFNSKEEALAEYENNYPKFKLKKCEKCIAGDKA